MSALLFWQLLISSVSTHQWVPHQWVRCRVAWVRCYSAASPMSAMQSCVSTLLLCCLTNEYAATLLPHQWVRCRVAWVRCCSAAAAGHLQHQMRRDTVPADTRYCGACATGATPGAACDDALHSSRDAGWSRRPSGMPKVPLGSTYAKRNDNVHKKKKIKIVCHDLLPPSRKGGSRAIFTVYLIM